MTSPSASIGVAGFVVDRSGRRTAVVQTAPPVRSASVLKPLLAWVAGAAGPFAGAVSDWQSIARPSVTVSDNHSMEVLWTRHGEGSLLSALNERVGVDWHVDGQGEHPSLRVMVTSDELAWAYSALAGASDEAAVEVRRWMREVPQAQTFGVRGIAREVLAVAEDAVGVKCGWFGGERAHAVVLVDTGRRSVGAVVTTSMSIDEVTLARMRSASGDDTRLVAAHDELIGKTIREAMQRGLAVARSL